MLTYTADGLLSLCHSRPPSRAVRKAIFSARVRLETHLIARMSTNM